MSDEGEPGVDGEVDGTREPSLGAPDQAEHGTQERWAAGARGDHEREVDDDLEPHVDDEHGGDDEHSMGWANPMGWRIGDPVPFDGADFHAAGYGSDSED